MRLRAQVAGILVAGLAIPLAGCGGGGGGSTPTQTTLTPQTRQAAVTAIRRVNVSGGLAGVIGRALFRSLSLAGGLPGRSRGRQSQQGTLPDGSQYTITANPDGSTTTTITPVEGGSMVFTTGAPQVQGTVSTVHFSLTTTLPASGGSVALQGNLTADSKGTPTTGSDDTYGLTATLGGTVTEPGVGSVTLEGSLTGSGNAAGLTLHSSVTANASDGSSVETTEDLAANLLGAGTYAQTITYTDPAGHATVLSAQLSANGTGTVTLTQQHTGLSMSVGIATNGTGTGTLMWNGQKIGDISVTAAGQATITFIDSTVEVIDLSDLGDALEPPSVSSLVDLFA